MNEESSMPLEESENVKDTSGSCGLILRRRGAAACPHFTGILYSKPSMMPVSLLVIGEGKIIMENEKVSQWGWQLLFKYVISISEVVSEWGAVMTRFARLFEDCNCCKQAYGIMPFTPTLKNGHGGELRSGCISVYKVIKLYAMSVASFLFKP